MIKRLEQPLVCTCYRQDRVKRAIDFRVSRSKQLHLMSTFGEVLTKIKDNPLRPPMALRWDRKIDAGDLTIFISKGSYPNYFAAKKNRHSMRLYLVARHLIAFRLVPCGRTIQAFHIKLIVVNQRAPIGSTV